MIRTALTICTALAAGAALLLAAPGRADPMAGSRSDAEIAAMDLSAIGTALTEDKAVLLHYLAELHRRHPQQVEQPDMAGVPALEPESLAALRGASDDQLAQSVEVVSGEVDRLVARGELARAQVGRAAPVPSPGPSPAPTRAAASDDGEKGYCYTMYGKAYALCASDDRSCKMFAANDYGICKKTGRWP